MTKLIWLTPALALTGCAANVPVVTAGAPAVKSAAIAGDACRSNNYSYLVGRPMTDAREIADRDYRLAAGAVAATRANRVTLIYNAQTQRITDIRCG